MNTRHALAATIVATSVSACNMQPSAPIIEQYNGSSVNIQESNLFGEANPANPGVVAEANRICGTGQRRADYASTIYNGQTYTASHLFLCL